MDTVSQTGKHLPSNQGDHMRSTKLTAAFAALALVFSLAGLVASPAQAAKPKHDLSSVQGGETASHQFFIKGKISTLPNKNVTVQKKPKGKSYGFYKKAETNAKGKFRVNIDGKVGDCFKVVAPATKDYKSAQVVVGCIIRG
jgi:hypothetical protein